MNRLALSFAGWLLVFVAAAPAWAGDDIAFFEARIRPVLVKHCFECHSSSSPDVKGGLLVDHREGLRAGGDSGPAVVPYTPNESLLLQALRYESFEMPPHGKLPDAVIDDFEQWIQKGAADPRDEPPSPTDAAELLWTEQLAERSRWWSLQPLNVVPPPVVHDDARSIEPVDQFVLSALLDAGLSPSPPADAATLLRRLSFVLTGLPPQPEQVRSFPEEFASDAERGLESVVDELLDSPHFGERFARHWMDVIRYTDTYGYEWDNPAKGSWEYRDYLIRAFNDDVGFDQLIREQIAGDLLPEPRINESLGINESLIGTVFYHLGEHRHGSSLAFNGIHQDMVDNKIDAFSKAFLAMTVACARCHNHKLDAIAQADYYALAGVFMTPRWTPRVIDAPGRYDAEIAELKRLRAEIHREMAALWQSHVQSMQPSQLREWAASQATDWKDATIDETHWPLARLNHATDEHIAQLWSDMVAEWQAAHDERTKANAETFTVLTDFREPGFPDGWVNEGDGIAHGFVEDGVPLVSLEGDTLIDRLLPRGYHTHALSSKLPGAVKLPPQQQLPGQYVSLQLCGDEWSGHIVVPQNAFQNEPLTFLGGGAKAAGWISTHDENLTNGVSRVLTEVATASLHPNFPPRTGLARAAGKQLADEDDGFDKRSWFSLTGIVAHDEAGPPTDTLVVFARLMATAPPTTVEEGWQRVSDWLTESVERWACGNATTADVRLLNWLLEHDRLPNQMAEAPAIAALVVQYRETEALIGFPRTAMSMDEREIQPLDYRLNIRGNVDEEGPAVPRGFLKVFAEQQNIGDSSGSGRLELAEFLSSRENPQTARVYVNRVWQWIFGTGIVDTPSDFGKLGGRPSHPELLDWLAWQFMEDGWSTKALVRRLVLSQTFRQSGVVSAEAMERDADNRLLHHYPTRRLEAEAIRDSLLAVSGRLDRSLYGPPIRPPRTVKDPAKRLFSGPLDSSGRRSIYLQMSIMDPPKLLVCFNLPDVRLPTGRRDVTNVPAQALALLNDPLVVQLSQEWGARLVDDGCPSAEERVGAMFRRALGREPDTDERKRWTAAVTNFCRSGDVLNDADAWAELAHALFNTKEFIYYR